MQAVWEPWRRRLRPLLRLPAHLRFIPAVDLALRPKLHGRVVSDWPGSDQPAVIRDTRNRLDMVIRDTPRVTTAAAHRKQSSYTTSAATKTITTPRKRAVSRRCVRCAAAASWKATTDDRGPKSKTPFFFIATTEEEVHRAIIRAVPQLSFCVVHVSALILRF